jgi:hypothetical protein
MKFPALHLDLVITNAQYLVWGLEIVYLHWYYRGVSQIFSPIAHHSATWDLVFSGSHLSSFVIVILSCFIDASFLWVVVVFHFPQYIVLISFTSLYFFDLMWCKFLLSIFQTHKTAFPFMYLDTSHFHIVENIWGCSQFDVFDFHLRFQTFLPSRVTAQTTHHIVVCEKARIVSICFYLSASYVQVCFTSAFVSPFNLMFSFSYHPMNKLFPYPATLRIHLKFDFTLITYIFHFFISRWKIHTLTLLQLYCDFCLFYQLS